MDRLKRAIRSVAGVRWRRVTGWLAASLLGIATVIATQAENDADFLCESTADSATIIRYTGKAKRVILPERHHGQPVVKLAGFGACPEVESIVISASVTDIECDFTGCVNLTQLSVHPANARFSDRDGVLFNQTQTELVRYPVGRPGHYTVPSAVTIIGNGAFSGCPQLTGVTLGGAVARVGYSAFAKCPQLGEILLPNSVANVGNCAFSGCANLTNAVLSSGLTNLGICLFTGCARLTQVTLPEGVPFIGMAMFDRCYALSQVRLPNSVTLIEGNAFTSCGNLSRITLSSNLQTIGKAAFANCVSLTNIVIGKKVSLIEDLAFANCPHLERVYFEGNAPGFGTNAVFKASNRATLYYHPHAQGWEPAFANRPTAEWPVETAK
jgi:hypothetical protein